MELNDKVKELLSEHSYNDIRDALREVLMEGPTIEIVLNNEHGGYLPPHAYDWMVARGYVSDEGKDGGRDYFYPDRTHPLTIQCVKDLKLPGLEIETIPANVDWELDDYDGIEWVEW